MPLDNHRFLQAAFAQVKVMGPRVGHNKAAVQGACHNFSLHWISLILGKPEGAAADRMAALAANSGGANPLLQKVFGDRWGLEGANEADDLMCKIHGLITKDVFPYSAYDQGRLKSALQAVGTGFVYSFWFAGGIVGAEGGAHSVAFYVNKHGTNLAIHFFDPNFGEFLFTDTEFDGFWSELIGTYGPMKQHWMRSAVAGQKMVLGGR